jgi:hypothetical protein
MHIFHFKTAQEAWEKINEWFIIEGAKIAEKSGNLSGNEITAYNVFFRAEEGRIDPDFDFGNMFGYRNAKWTSLVGNYVDNDELDIVKARIQTRETKKQNKYTETMKFHNSHGHGKGCLNSITFHKRNKELYPTLCMNLRASEVTKRLIVDLLLAQRIGQYIYGENAHFAIEFFCPNTYQVVESGIMYHSHKNLKKLIRKKGDVDNNIYTRRCLDKLIQFLKIDIDKVSYKVHKRTIRQIQRENGIPLSGDKPMLAKQLWLDKIIKP